MRRVRLTRAGRAERSELERRSDERARSLLEPLSKRQRAELVSAMSTVDRLLQASLVTFAVEDSPHGDARWCLARYFAELKRMWISHEARGLGIGRRMLRQLERYSWAAGARVIPLETNGALSEAIARHRSAGYREVAAFNAEPHAHHWFDKRLPRSSAHSLLYMQGGLERPGEADGRLRRVTT